MKPHIIEIERVDGAMMTGIEIEVQGPVQVMLDPEPLEAVYESKVRMSIDTAAQLVIFLAKALHAAQTKPGYNWTPPRDYPLTVKKPAV